MLLLSRKKKSAQYNSFAPFIDCLRLMLMCDFFVIQLTVKEHYTSNKTRNAQVREDVPRARVEQELEALRYQNYIQQQLVT